jgi:hypothetical protein
MNIPPPSGQPIKMPEAVNNGIANIGNSFNAAKAGLTNSMNQFSQQAQAGVGASSQFLQSNTIVAKLAFIVIAIIAFLFLLNLGIMLISYFTTPSSNPYLIHGMIDGTYAMVVPQDPTNKDALPIVRSNNQNKGIEFTWSFWIYINELGTDSKKYQHIFNKGDNTYNSSTNLSSINNAPGVYLGPANNNLHIVMDTVNGSDKNKTIDIDNIPIRKWVHVAIRMQNLVLDVYVNGVVSSRLILNNVPKQNYNDVYICQSGGFAGKLSNLRYLSYAMNVFEINNVVLGGPNLKVTDSTSKSSGYTYLSTSWYTSKL